MPSADITVDVEHARSAFRWNERELSHLLTGPTGGVARDLVRRAIRVESAAKIHASEPPRFGPNTGSEPGRGPAVRTGRLRGSITWRLGRDAFGIYADIGSAVLYAPYVELGTTRMAARPFLRPALEMARI